MKIFLYIVLAVTAIAGDSFFTRLALTSTDIDHTTFSLLRIFSACLIIILVVPVNEAARTPSKSVTFYLSALFTLYIFAFSYAYTELSISIGGLVIFAVTQICSIFCAANSSGSSLSSIQWFGLLTTSIGALSLLSPLITLNNSITAIFVMVLAGVAWAGFTLTSSYKGFSIFSLRNVFKLTLAMISLPLLINLISLDILLTMDGYVYAVLCGALTTGLGYTLWLLITDTITPLSTSTALILAPLITIIFGLFYLSETFSIAAASASILILFGMSIFHFSEYLKNMVREQ